MKSQYKKSGLESEESQISGTMDMSEHRIPVMMTFSVLIFGSYLAPLDTWTDIFTKSLVSSRAECQSDDYDTCTYT